MKPESRLSSQQLKDSIQQRCWPRCKNEDADDLMSVRFGDVASLDKALTHLKDLLPGSKARRYSKTSRWRAS